MLQAISKANHNSRFVYVMDTRPKVASEKEPGASYRAVRSYFRVQSEEGVVLVSSSRS